MLYQWTIFIHKCCKICRLSAKQTIPLSFLARNQTKGLDSRSRRDRKLARKRQRRWTRERREVIWRQATERGSGQSTPVSRRDQSAWDRVQKQVREDQSRWVGIPSSFLEISRRMHVSVSLQMHQECRVSQLNLLARDLTQAHIVCLFFVLFLPLPWLYFLCHKEMYDTPVGTTRWFTGQDWNVSKKFMYSGAEWISSHYIYIYIYIYMVCRKMWGN